MIPFASKALTLSFSACAVVLCELQYSRQSLLIESLIVSIILRFYTFTSAMARCELQFEGSLLFKEEKNVLSLLFGVSPPILVQWDMSYLIFSSSFYKINTYSCRDRGGGRGDEGDQEEGEEGGGYGRKG